MESGLIFPWSSKSKETICEVFGRHEERRKNKDHIRKAGEEGSHLGSINMCVYDLYEVYLYGCKYSVSKLLFLRNKKNWKEFYNWVL